jgi:hypothetical protein
VTGFHCVAYLSLRTNHPKPATVIAHVGARNPAVAGGRLSGFGPLRSLTSRCPVGDLSLRFTRAGESASKLSPESADRRLCSSHGPHCVAAQDTDFPEPTSGDST